MFVMYCTPYNIKIDLFNIDTYIHVGNEWNAAGRVHTKYMYIIINNNNSNINCGTPVRVPKISKNRFDKQ